MKRIYLLLATSSLLLGVSTAHARQLTPEEALAAVPAKMLPASTRSSSSDLVYTQKSGGLNAAYVWAFQPGQGYMVVSADDVLPPVLGYSDSGTFDPNNIPPALEYWLSEYGRQLEYAVSHNISVAYAREKDNPSLNQLCSTKWGQDSPYYDLCPMVGNSHCPTGCTATAMAQMTYYHKWPKKGTGTNTYSHGSFTNLTFDFGNTEFDWDNMSKTYTSGYTQAQVDAVATLMAACGNASLMQYAQSVSGAYLYDGLYGLVKYMGYDKGGYEAQRNFYSADEWDSLIYSELAAGRPVIYSGYSNGGKGGGHTFIVDGYRSGGYYHVNWGWDGTSDGYFLLSILDPYQQGTGGSSGGYDSFQSALIGMKPAEEGSSSVLMIYQGGDLKGKATSYSRTEDVTMAFNSGYLLYCTLEDKPVTLGLNLKNENGGTTTFCGGDQTILSPYYGNAGSGCYIYNFVIPGSAFPTSGTYIATPAYKEGGQVKEIRGQVGYSNKVKITISSNTIKIAQMDADITLEARDLKVASPLYVGKNSLVKATLSSGSVDYMGNVYIGLKKTQTTSRFVAKEDPVTVNLAAGESREITFYGNFGDTGAGTYWLSVYDKTDVQLCDPIQVTIVEAPTETLAYTVKYEFDSNIQGSGTSADPYIVGDQLQFKLNVSVESGFLDDTLQVYTMKGGGSSYFDGLGDPIANYVVGAGDTYSNTYTLLTEALPLDTSARIRAYANTSRSWVGNAVYIKRSTSGVNDIEADNDAPVEYYTVSGVRVENPTPGLYIRKQGSKVTKVIIK